MPADRPSPNRSPDLTDGSGHPAGQPPVITPHLLLGAPRRGVSPVLRRRGPSGRSCCRWQLCFPARFIAENEIRGTRPTRSAPPSKPYHPRLVWLFASQATRCPCGRRSMRPRSWPRKAGGPPAPLAPRRSLEKPRRVAPPRPGRLRSPLRDAERRHTARTRVDGPAPWVFSSRLPRGARWRPHG